MLARLVDPNSTEYVRGYNEGRGNLHASPGPFVREGLENYQEGFRRGKAEAEAAATSSAPVETPDPQTPAVDVVTFKNPDLQQVWDAKSAAQRVYNPSMMAQGALGTCGPATILNFLGTNDPRGYADLVVEVYRRRDGEGQEHQPEAAGHRAAGPGMQDALDWKLMSAVQDITNDWYEFYGTKEGEQKEREGTGSSDQRWAHKHFAGVSKAETIDTPKHDDVLPAARRVSGLVTTPGVAINMHLSAAVLQSPARSPTSATM